MLLIRTIYEYSMDLGLTTIDLMIIYILNNTFNIPYVTTLIKLTSKYWDVKLLFTSTLQSYIEICVIVPIIVWSKVG